MCATPRDAPVAHQFRRNLFVWYFPKMVVGGEGEGKTNENLIQSVNGYGVCACVSRCVCVCVQMMQHKILLSYTYVSAVPW